MTTKIGFFDSGIGGVTVLKECIKLNNNFQYVYYSDSVNNPYGDKSKDELILIVSNVVSKLIDLGCYIIVIACNTASSVCVSYLRSRYENILFIAIEPAVKVAYDNNVGANTLIMATKGTIDSDKFKRLYHRFCYNNFYLLSCVGLANLIENGNDVEIKEYLVNYLSKYRDKVSVVVLGCTHYPLIKKEISEILGDVIFCDGSFGVANQLRRVILDKGYVGNVSNEVVFFDSSGDVNKEKRFWAMLGGNHE